MNVKNRFESKYKQPPTATKNINLKDKKSNSYIYIYKHTLQLYILHCCNKKMKSQVDKREIFCKKKRMKK